MTWKQDAQFVRTVKRGGDWEIGLRIARSCDKLKGSERPRLGRVSLAKFAEESGLEASSARYYFNAWQIAAAEGLVDPSEDLTADTEYDWDDGGPADWNVYYGRARYADGEIKRKPTKREVEHAIKTDPEIAKAARQAVEAHSTAAEDVIAERETGSALINAAAEETERRHAIKELLKAAKAISEQASGIASYGIVGVADEVDWLRQASSHLTDAQWAIGSSITETFEETTK